jgi:ribosomal protein S12 methylthiotransferase accessory factor YcaO
MLRREAARSAVFEYLEGFFYTRRRLHSSFGYVSSESYKISGRRRWRRRSEKLHQTVVVPKDRKSNRSWSGGSVLTNTAIEPRPRVPTPGLECSCR